MTTANESSVPYFGRGSRSVPVTDVPANPALPEGHRRRTLVLAFAAGAVAIAGVAGLQYARTAGEAEAVVPGSALAKAMTVRDAYAPGGSVYEAQVPAADAGLAAYRPGGSVYDAQVPTAESDRAAYRPGGSVYDSQVPGQ